MRIQWCFVMKQIKRPLLKHNIVATVGIKKFLMLLG